MTEAVAAVKRSLPGWLTLGGTAVTPMIVGTAAGLGAWWLQDAIAQQIQAKNWLIPVVAGVGGFGVTGYFMVRMYYS